MAMIRIVALIAVLLAWPIDARAQLAIDVPAPNVSTPLPTVAGWACHAQNNIGPNVDGVQVWTQSFYTGGWTFLGAATTGIARPDVASAVDINCLYSGYSLSVTASVQLGPAMVYAFGHDTITGSYSLVNSVYLTIGDPCDMTRCAAITSLTYYSTGSIAVTGYGVVNANAEPPSRVSAWILVDDWGGAFATPTASGACANFPTWNCRGAEANQPTPSPGPGVITSLGLAPFNLASGWHFARIWLTYDVDGTIPHAQTTASNAWWFYIS